MGPAVRACIQVLCNEGVFDVGVAGEVLAMALASSDKYRSDDERLWRDVGGRVYDLPMCSEECNRYSRLSKLD